MGQIRNASTLKHTRKNKAKWTNEMDKSVETDWSRLFFSSLIVNEQIP